jgi:charged multivesicular body protein 4A/B
MLHRDALRTQQEIGNEISEAITNPLDTNRVDEDELDEELANMQQEQLDEQMLNTGNVPVGDTIGRLPSVAQGEVKGKGRVGEEEDEEEELRKLQAEMAI